MERLDLPAAEAFLRGQVERLEAPTWSELTAKIGRLGHWEFEDYQASASTDQAPL